MVIIVGNQKGGAGKSTLTMFMANYLTLVKGYDVTVLDMDYQRSIFQLYEKAKVLENDEPYEVIEADLEYFPSLFDILSKKKDRIIMIDLPGKLDDDALIPVLQNADLVITPFAYNELSFTSTIMFGIVLKKLNQKADIFFVPNIIKSSVNYDVLKNDAESQLSRIGIITNPLPDRVDFQRITTFSNPLSLLGYATAVFDKIIEKSIVPFLGEGKEVTTNE